MEDFKNAKSQIEILDEKIKAIEEKKRQLTNRKQTLLQREKEKERKQRTRRLIQIGAISETFFGQFDNEKAFSDFLEKNSNLISKFIK